MNNNILMPAFNAQNDTGFPESNKQNVKYPYYVSGGQGSTYGIPFMDSSVEEVYNSAGPKGFFTGDTSSGWTVQTSSAYTITSNYYVELDSLSGGTQLNLELDPISPTTGTPSVGDYVTIFIDGFASGSTVNTNPILTYRIQGLSPSVGTTGQTPWILTVDREIPDYTSYSLSLIHI